MVAEPVTIKSALNQAITAYGADLLKNPKRLSAILKDYAPTQGREIKLIENALREGVGDILITAKGQSEAEQRRSLLRGKQLLVDNLYIAENAASLAVETIAFALGIKTENDAEANYQEGLRYANGDGVPQDFAQKDKESNKITRKLRFGLAKLQIKLMLMRRKI